MFSLKSKMIWECPKSSNAQCKANDRYISTLSTMCRVACLLHIQPKHYFPGVVFNRTLLSCQWQCADQRKICDVDFEFLVEKILDIWMTIDVFKHPQKKKFGKRKKRVKKMVAQSAKQNESNFLDVFL